MIKRLVDIANETAFKQLSKIARKPIYGTYNDSPLDGTPKMLIPITKIADFGTYPYIDFLNSKFLICAYGSGFIKRRGYKTMNMYGKYRKNNFSLEITNKKSSLRDYL